MNCEARSMSCEACSSESGNLPNSGILGDCFTLFAMTAIAMLGIAVCILSYFSGAEIWELVT